MYSRDETVSAVLAFYQQVIKHPYLNETALRIPPAKGWDFINVEAMKARGKNDAVIDLLRYLPYLRDDRGNRLLVNTETVPICYTEEDTYMDDVYPLPSHCVYLTQGVDREGLSLIMDTERGTVTAYSIMAYEVDVDHDELENLPESQKWQAHRTTPVTEFFAWWALCYARLVWMLVPNPSSGPTTGRYYSRARTDMEEKELCNRDVQEWHPDTSHATPDSIADLVYIEDVYNTHRRYGWPSDFDKNGCRAKLLELGKQKSAEERRLLKELDSD